MRVHVGSCGCVRPAGEGAVQAKVASQFQVWNAHQGSAKGHHHLPLEIRCCLEVRGGFSEPLNRHLGLVGAARMASVPLLPDNTHGEKKPQRNKTAWPDQQDQ